MRRSLAVLMLASIVATAASGLVGVSLSHAQTMKENATFIQSAGYRMNQDRHHGCNGNMSAHMNATQHIRGNIHDKLDELHDRLNMTEHMRGTH